MNELIPVIMNENQEPVISGRGLHEFLNIGTEYMKWFERMTEYGFTDGIDFSSILTESTGGRPSTDHALKLDMAKELSMIQRNEKGKQARQYFIQVEKNWNAPDKIIERAMKILEIRNAQLQLESKIKDQQIAELKPKADYMDRILQSKGTININAIAKDYGMSGARMNKILHELNVQYLQDKQWLLYAKHQDKGYTHSKTIDFEHKDGSPDTRLHTQWTQKGRLFLYELLKQNGYLPVIEQKQSA